MVDDACEQFRIAVTSSDLNKVKLMLSDGFDVNVKLGRELETFLHLAKDVDIINELILNGANVNAINLAEASPLYRAIKENKGLPVVQALLSAKADVHFEYDECSLLHYSFDGDIIRALVSHGLDVNVRNYEGRTPLHQAIEIFDTIETVKVLVKCGADVNAIDNEGQSILLSLFYSAGHTTEDAIWSSHVITELLESGADINLQSSECDIYISPLGEALRSDNLTLIELVIRVTLLLYFEDDYKKVIDLDPYLDAYYIENAINYLDECAMEIMKLKRQRVSKKHSLYDFVSFKKSEKIKPLYYTKMLAKRKISKKYPIYQDIVLSRIKLCLEKGQLLEKFREFKIYALKPGYQKVFLISDCISKISEYLSLDDLANFTAAFYVNNL